MSENKELMQLWRDAPEVDRKAIIGSIRAHVRQSTERLEQYLKQYEDSRSGGSDLVIVNALKSRADVAKVALSILGEEA